MNILSYFYYDNQLLMFLVIGTVILSMWAQYKVSSTFNKFSRIASERGYLSQDVAQRILSANGISNVSLTHTGGSLTDHYDPRKRQIRLSQTVHGSSSIAAITIAAHEAGHAIQHNQKYPLLMFRNIIAPIATFASSLAFPLILLGLFLGFTQLVEIAAWVFFAILIFQFITLPVEFNASHRALKALEGQDILQPAEIPAAKSMLFSAALTYIAATLSALVQFIRLISISRRR